jgi:hypothetical protein
MQIPTTALHELHANKAFVTGFCYQTDLAIRPKSSLFHETSTSGLTSTTHPGTDNSVSWIGVMVGAVRIVSDFDFFSHLIVSVCMY